MSESKIDPELLKEILNRPIAMYHKDHVKALLIVICQGLGWADRAGVLTMGLDKQTEQEAEK